MSSPSGDLGGAEEAIAECARLVGSQFTKSAVGALLKLHARGELDPTIQGSRRSSDLVSPAAESADGDGGLPPDGE